MKKLKEPFIIFLVSVMILSLAGCSSSDSSEDEPLSLVGNWEPEVIGEDDYQAGFITEDSITIYWMSVSDSGMTSASLYWAGTYEAPTEDTDSYSWESVNDTNQTESASQASDSETKTFTYEDGVLSYTVTVSDTTTLYELVMTDTDYSVYTGDANEIDSSDETDNDTAEEEVETTDDVTAEETDEVESETSETADADSESSEESETVAETSADEGTESSSIEDEEYKQVELLDSGYSIYDRGNGYYYIYFAAEIYNPNESYAVESSELQITIREEDGSIITTEDQLVGNIAAGDTYYFADNFQFEGTISSNATVEISISSPTSDVYYTPQQSSDVPYADELVISNTSFRSGSSYKYFTGEMTNNSSTDLSSVTVVVLFRLDGAIIGGEYTYLHDIAAGETEAFEISSLSGFTGYDSYEIYANPGF